MPKCHKCNSHFPNQIKLEGGIRTLGNRKHCLDCSPYGAHNTRKVEVERASICVVCGGKHHLKGNICRYCTNKIARWRLKLAMVIAKGSVCERCRWSGNPVAFDFHHLDPALKEVGLNMSTRSRVAMMRELEKCVLLCTRCHRLEHASEHNSEFWEQVFNYRGGLEIGKMEDWDFLK